MAKVGNQVAQRREQLLEKGMRHQQLDSVLAEFKEQQIKAAKDTKAAHAKAKQQGSTGEDDGAIAIASLAVAGEAREVAAGSAVAREAREVAAGSAIAREAEQYAVWYKDADIEDDGFGPPCPEPNRLGGASWAPTCRSYIGEQSQHEEAEYPVCFCP